MKPQLQFISNHAIAGRPEQFAEITVDTRKVIESWKLSLHSYEWLDPQGRIKPHGDLSPAEAEKRHAVEEAVKLQDRIEKPVLGIGIMENVEIGVGRATFLTLFAMGYEFIPVHIPKSNEKDFKAFLGAVK